MKKYRLDHMPDYYSGGLHPGFCLNLHDRNENPLFESHDPSMFYDEKSGYYYSYSTDAAITSGYRQGIPIRKSANLIDFEWVGHALSKEAVREGADNGTCPPTRGFWAPFVEKAGEEYRMYYSATKAFGSSESRIHLAVSDSPEGPFENRGVVVNTWNTTDEEPNGIDPHIIDDTDGRKWLVYGSFFGGIYIKELNPETGLCMDGNERNLGCCIAKKPRNSYIDGPEGAAVIYVPEEEYYYLFISYGWLGDDYDIRVGRSKCVTGPYRDYVGKDLKEESLGLKCAGSYFFPAENPYVFNLSNADTEYKNLPDIQKRCKVDWIFAGFRGPGHGVPFYDPKSGEYFFVHHVRDGAKEGKAPRNNQNRDTFLMHYMCVRRMYFVNGWPVFSPEPFAGEKAAEHIRNLGETENIQSFDWIVLENDDNMLKAASILPVNPDDIYGYLGEAYDFENSSLCTVFTGRSGDGRAVWGKLRITCIDRKERQE